MSLLALQDFEPGDVLLYPANSDPAFKALAWAQRIAGLRDAITGHVGMIYRMAPNKNWLEEVSAYTNPYPGQVQVSAKYPYVCDVLRFPELDTDAAATFLKKYLGQSYGYSALLWMGLWRKAGIKTWTLPGWTGWKHVCSPLVLGALRAGGVDPLPGLNTSLAMPADFEQAISGRIIGRWAPGS